MYILRMYFMLIRNNEKQAELLTHAIKRRMPGLTIDLIHEVSRHNQHMHNSSVYLPVKAFFSYSKVIESV